MPEFLYGIGLKDDASTSDLFAWLDANKPNVAKSAFDRSQFLLLPALVNMKKFGLAGKYVNPDTSFKHALKLYRSLISTAKKENMGTELNDFADRDLIHTTSTLIAVLVLADRKADAQEIVDEVSRESNLPDFKTQIQNALRGEIPR
jgi:hypothetical protein